MSISHTISHTSQTIQMFESQSPPPRSQQQLQLLLPVLLPLPLRLLLLLLLLILLLLLLLLLLLFLLLLTPPPTLLPSSTQDMEQTPSGKDVAAKTQDVHHLGLNLTMKFCLGRYHNVGRNVEFMYKYKSRKIDG